jgi:gluconate 2-dehydrogenase subunit 3-like protein
VRRRDIIALFGSLPFGNVAGLWRQTVSLRNSGSTDHVTRTVAAIADVMFPGDGLPNAAALGVHNSVLEMKDLQASITKAIAWLDEWAGSQSAADFLALNEASRVAAIDAAFVSPNDGMQQFVLAMRFHLGTAYYSQPSVKAAFAYAGPPQPEGFADFQEPPA